MKRFFAVLMMLMLIVAMVGCSQKKPAPSKTDDSLDDGGNYTDSSNITGTGTQESGTYNTGEQGRENEGGVNNQGGSPNSPGNQGNVVGGSSKNNTGGTVAPPIKPPGNVKVPDNMNLTGFPIAKKQVTLNIMVNTSASQPDFSKVKMFQEYEKMSNVKVKWNNIPAGNTRTKVMMAFASKDLPDAFLKCGSILNNNNQYSFAKDGMLFNMNADKKLENFAPNFNKFYSDNSDVKKAMTFEGGAVYSFPQGVDAIPNKVAGKLFVNQKWLKAVNMKMPTTTDELYNVLVAFRDKDPNGNKQKDEIPLSSPNYNYITYMLYGAFGLGNRGVHNTYVDMNEKTGKPRLIAASAEYKDYLIYLNKLYKENLLDRDIFTMTNAQYVAKQASNKVGVFCYTNLATIPDEIGNDFKGVDVALKGPAGHQFWYPVRSKLHSTGAFVITNECKNPEIAMRWADYFYSDEGNLLYNYGVEGESHTKQKDGSYKFVKSVYDVIDSGLTFDAAVAPHVAVGGSNPLIAKEPYFYGREMDPIPSKAANNMVKYFPKEIWPNFIFTPREFQDLSIISTEIEMYITKSAASFITGRENMNNWDKYVKRLETMQMQKMLDIYNSAYQRVK